MNFPRLCQPGRQNLVFWRPVFFFRGAAQEHLDEFPIHPMPPGEYDGMKETSNLPEEVIHLMPDRVSPGPLCGNHPPKEAVCIHTRKVYDSCREGQEPFYRGKTRSRPGCMPGLLLILSLCGLLFVPGFLPDGGSSRAVLPGLHGAPSCGRANRRAGRCPGRRAFPLFHGQMNPYDHLSLWVCAPAFSKSFMSLLPLRFI